MNYKNVFFETPDFFLAVPNPPHIDRKDGGHIVVVSKKNYNNFYDMPYSLSREMIFLAQRCGYALQKTLVSCGIEIGIINYQINGNWSALNNVKDPIHMHIYGRAKNSEHQKYGEALFFPNPDKWDYNMFQPLTDDEVSIISRIIREDYERQDGLF